ncbi:EpsG family protein [Bacteroides uniformis]|uniref:EpsG family protein n=1 Tax=Bacteroides uniformis TaxID=820 RepID=A0AAW6GCK2_BACUN|nr:EpsG family protein [Bacteroides uniformis]MDC1854464.1 EpsG family protein [Bacteroides uniformis]MDC1860696.1 EpsG family protein [Bacteroides uniformis]MDC1873300.1 EpsG family protein [Bacteroides uniformis]
MVVFRYDVGTDYLEYTDYYYRIHSLFELTSEDFFVEPGYVLLSSLLRSIGAPFELLSFILFLIIVCNLKRAIAFFSDNIPLSVVLYVFLFFLSFHFNLIRHGVMVSFVWKGYSWWFVGKKKRAFISLVCGAMFHALSLCFLSLLFIHLRKYPIYICRCFGVFFYYICSSRLAPFSI